jgi:tRNA 2-thiouridine synthesizing protein E
MIIQARYNPLRILTVFSSTLASRPLSLLSPTAIWRKEISMEQFTSNPQDSETAGRDMDERLAELTDHSWNRNKSRALAQSEGVELGNEHWAVITFLRNYYLHHGLPIHARITATALSKHFARLGGNKYLHRLFAGGPVTQGSRFANLRTPAYATDLSFGTSY